MALRVALVLGGADCVWRDVEAALDLGEFAGVVACNDVAAAWPGRLDALVTLHAEKARRWLDWRATNGFRSPATVFGHKPSHGDLRHDGVTATTDYRFPGQTDTGSSGLFAGKVALVDLGFDRAVFCGTPMEAAGAHFFDATAWQGAISHRRGWRQAAPRIKDRARSMSGWTRELLGAPDEGWLSA